MVKLAEEKKQVITTNSYFFLSLCVVFVVVVELRVRCSSSARANRSCDEILWGYSPLVTYTWRDDSVIANRVWLHYHRPLTAQVTHWMTESNCREKKTCVVSKYKMSRTSNRNCFGKCERGAKRQIVHPLLNPRLFAVSLSRICTSEPACSGTLSCCPLRFLSLALV